MTDGSEARPDLAAMLQPFVRSLIAAELPRLAAHGVTMWGYCALMGLQDSPVRTQAALAEAIGADKTRIIADLDALQEAGLITRDVDPEDRRVRLLSITDAGRRVYASARSAIQTNEERLLARLPSADRAAFLRSVRTLSRLSRTEIVGDP